ncbi:MAG: hypothetical protein E6R03_02555 [Hyphomicrobiaceae bacterium]|nr:MAG: hypothetical protein E6R03_02555 [Hyphomicrobiaceae bacterium]
MLPAPIFRCATTRGEHWFYDTRGEDPIRSRNNFSSKVDIKGVGGYVRAVDPVGLLDALSRHPVDYSGHDRVIALWPKQRRRSTGTARLSLVGYGTSLPLNCTLYLDDGREMALRDMEPGDHLPCYSPVRSENNPSAFAHAMEDGRVFVHDSATAATHWWVGRLGAVEEREAIHVALRPEEWVSDVLPSLHNLRGTMVLGAGLGLGKTTWAHELARDAVKVLSVAPEVALVDSLARARNSASYKDEARGGPRVATTIHSAKKIPAMPRDLVVIEEAPLVARSFFDDTAKGQGRARLVALLDHLEHAARLVISSADFSEDLAQWWSRLAILAGHAPPKHVDLQGLRKNRTIQIMDRERLLADFMLDVQGHAQDGTVVLCTSRAKDARAVGKQVQDLRPDLRLAVLTSKTAADHAELLAQPDRLAQLDVVICTGVLRSGYSVDAQITRVYMDAPYSKVPVGDLCQAVLRWRTVTDTTIRCAVALGTGIRRATEHAEIREEVLQKGRQTDHLLDHTPIAFAWAPGDHREPATEVDELLLDLWVILERQARIEAADRLGEFVRVCERHGWAVITDDRTVGIDEKDLARKARREANRAIVEADYAAVIAAEPITGEVRDQRAVAAQLTTTERAELEAAEIRIFYGEIPTRETVEGGEELREAISEYVRVEAASRQDIRPAALLDASQRDYTPAERGHYIQRAKFLAEAFAAAGVDLQSGGVIGPKWSSWCNKHMTLLRTILGTKAQDPTRLFGLLVRYLGGKSKRHYRTVDGHRVAVPMADFSRSWALSKYQRQRVSGEIAANDAVTRSFLGQVA